MTRSGAIRHACCSCALALAVSACAGERIRPGIPLEVTGQRINPFELHEECVQLTPEDRLVYRFTAQRPVAFNIHYHEGQAVVMPITREKSREHAGFYTARLAQDYCLMWEAGAAGASIDYRILVKPAAS